MNSVLIVCVGNVCRSPIAEAILHDGLPGWNVASAGIHAAVGRDIDETARSVAEAHGVRAPQRQAQQFTTDLGTRHDLILVLEDRHKAEIIEIAPQLSGRIMRLSKWTGDEDIPDPYRKNLEFHEAVFRRISEAASAWIERLTPKKAD